MKFRIGQRVARTGGKLDLLEDGEEYPEIGEPVTVERVCVHHTGKDAIYLKEYPYAPWNAKYFRNISND